MNVVPLDIIIQLAQPASVTIPDIKRGYYKIKTPFFDDKNFRRINLLNNKINIKPYDDLSEYLKQN